MRRVGLISTISILFPLVLPPDSAHASSTGKFTPMEEEVVPGLLERVRLYPVDRRLKSLGNPLYLTMVWYQQYPMLREGCIAESDVGWVRLQAAKEYYHMAAILKEYPKVHLTINLTPFLLLNLKETIEGYEKGEASDRLLTLTLKPSSELTDEEKEEIILQFFPANWKEVIAPHQRYEELCARRKLKPNGGVDIPETLRSYAAQDFLDLQTWFTLSWFEPDLWEGEVELTSSERVTVKPLVDKRRDFTEKEKLGLLGIQFKILKAIVPIYKKLQDDGQIEVTTSPFSNPVLPLICDSDLARRSMPTAPLPRRFSYPEDARAQVELAVELYRDAFGQSPGGLLTAEGSVCEELIPLLAECGLRWWVSDEEILARSLGKDFVGAHQLYRPYGLERDGERVTVLFRDAELSSALNSMYAPPAGTRAAQDLLMRLYDIHAQSAEWEVPPLVVLVARAERLWDSYHKEGKEFLRFLCSELSKADWVKTVTVQEYLDQFPPERDIENLWAGSWADGDFSAWIGEEEENLAWNYLLETRKSLSQAQGKVSAEKLSLAMEEIYLAESSHWFWWFGEDRSSPQGDRPSDRMFRRTLENVYYLLGYEPPAYLGESILRSPKEIQDRQEELLFSVDDPEGDDHGPGTYTYPTDESFPPGVLDLLRFEVLTTEGEVIFRLKFRELTNPWRAPLGFSHPLINIYLSTHGGEKSSTGTCLRGANVCFDSENPWDFLLKAAGWPGYGRVIYSAEGEVIGECEVSSNLEEKTVTISAARALIGDPEGSPWGYYVLIGSQDGFGPDNYRPIDETAGPWTGGGNKKGEKAPRVYDMLDPASNGRTQKEMLGSYRPNREELALLYPVILD